MMSAEEKEKDFKFYKLEINKLLQKISLNMKMEEYNFAKDLSDLSNLFDEIKRRFDIAFFKRVHITEDERDKWSDHMLWLVNLSLFISVYDQKISQISCVRLQKRIMLEANQSHSRRWWFYKMINVYIEILNQAMAWEDGCSELEISNLFIPATRNSELNFPKLAVCQEKQFHNLISQCLEVLQYCFPQFCNMRNIEEKLVRDIIVEALRKKPISAKIGCIKFLQKYLSNVALFDCEDRKFFLSIMHILASITKNMWLWTPDYCTEKKIEDLNNMITSFLQEAPVNRMKFQHSQDVQQLVLFCTEILYHQIKNTRAFQDIEDIVAATVRMLRTVLDEFNYTIETVGSLRILLELHNSKLYNVIKYLVVAEIEANTKFDCNVFKGSKSWAEIHKEILQKLDIDNKEQAWFSFNLGEIESAFLLAIQIDFEFSRRHQFRHGTNPKICFCLSLKNLLPTSALIEFTDWNYRHVTLNFFEKPDDTVNKLLNTLEQGAKFEENDVYCAINISSCILKLSMATSLSEVVKESLFGLVASPFYMPLKKDDNFNKSGGFKHIMASLPSNVKSFFEHLLRDHAMKQQQKASLSRTNNSILSLLLKASLTWIAQLQIGDLTRMCWFLTTNIIQYVKGQDDNPLKHVLFDSFNNLMINNYQQMDFLIGFYQHFATVSSSLCTIDPLADIMCLRNGNVVIIKILAGESDFTHFVVCNDCELSRIIYPKNTETHETDRWMALIKDTKGLLISPNSFKVGTNRVQPNFSAWMLQSNGFKMKLFDKIPSLLNHSEEFNSWIDRDDGQEFFEGIFVKDEKVLQKLAPNLKDIIRNIHKRPISEQKKKCLMANAFKQMTEIANFTAYGEDRHLHSLTVNLAYTFGTNFTDENTLVKCFKVLLLFIVQGNSKVMDEASLLAMKMAKFNGVSLAELFDWHKTFIMRHVVFMTITNYTQFEESIANSLYGMQRRLDFPRSSAFIPSKLDVIIAIVLPMAIIVPNLIEELRQVCTLAGSSFAEAIEINFLSIYQQIYTEKPTETLNQCLKLMTDETQKSVGALLQSRRDTSSKAMIYFHKSQAFVIEVFGEVIISTGDFNETIAKQILWILNYFESQLTLRECERVVKKNIVQSLGDIIIELCVSGHQPPIFPIITVLKSAAERAAMDLRKECIEVWKILIRHCNVADLGLLLSTIFVSLEVFIDDYPEEVNSMYKSLIVDNKTLLSRYIPDLFFIEKSRVDDENKSIILSQIAIQKKKERVTFRSNLSSFVQHLKNENSDVKVRIYCLMFLQELFEKHRKELNELICQESVDPLIDELLQILIHNFKSTSKETLQLVTANCLGELGAIEPCLMQQNFRNETKCPKSIYEKEFAEMALLQLCRLYNSDARYVNTRSLAIQKLFQMNDVTELNFDAHDLWKVIPATLRTKMYILLSSSYYPIAVALDLKSPFIFWDVAKTASSWAMIWSELLIQQLKDERTQVFLSFLKPSMKQSQQIISIFLPYIVLHFLMEDGNELNSNVVNEIQRIFDIILDNSESASVRGKKPLFVKGFGFIPHQTELPEDNITSVAVDVAKMIFEVFDFLSHYGRIYFQSKATVDKLLDKFDLDLLAKVNYKCGEYARAIIYMDEKIKKSPNDLQASLPFLTKIYARLDCPDEVGGIRALMTSEPSLAEKILISNVTGNFQDSAACFEQMMQKKDTKPKHIEYMVKSYIALNQPETALMVHENMIRKLDKSAQKKLSEEIKAQPLWQLSRFEELEELLVDKSIQQSPSWGVRCGQLLLKFRADDDSKFTQELQNSRLTMMKHLKFYGNEQTAYMKNYLEIVNLHLVSEFEKVEKTIEEIKNYNLLETDVSSVKHARNSLQNLISDWDARLLVVQKNVSVLEPIFCFRRVILNETKLRLSKIFDGTNMQKLQNSINGEIGKLWLKSTKLAFKNKMYQQAQAYILNAETYQPKQLFIVKAKLSWAKGDRTNTFKILEVGEKNLLNGGSVADLSKEDKETLAKGRLLNARFNAEALHVDFKTNKKLFLDAIVVQNEKIFLYAADYMDRHYSKESDNQARSLLGEPADMEKLLKYYYMSMIHGSEHVFQSMPRFLSIWLDTTARFKSNKPVVKSINHKVESYVKDLPLELFYTAFSQLLSRICHQSEETFKLLKSILINLVVAFPQQSLWFLVPLLKGSNSRRKSRCQEILSDVRLTTHQQLIIDFNLLIDNLIKLSGHDNQNPNTSTKTKYSLQEIAPELPRMLKMKREHFIMPFQCNLQMFRVTNENNKDSFMFADKMVTIHSIKDSVDVMRSLQRPKKITFIGSDGKEYPTLLKFKDDLRIDLRFMELTAVVKEFLNKDPESRQRRLTTRTYSAIPLNEKCGLIEWVPNLRTYKEVIMNEYKRKGHRPATYAEVKKKFPQSSDEEIHAILVKQYYPALGDYFRQQFTSPQNYLKARSSYIRSTAVISILGYIVGLGDRHCENILFDVTNGETFHVDFNMLFNKGESLAVPETVPFRLTHNMTDAMGALGIEGPFKKNCEIVLRIMQKEKNTLLAYLRPMVYDPLLKSYSHSKRDNAEPVEDEAVMNLQNIENRLKGIASKFKESSQISLSVEGHVNFIIEEATSEKNLSRMYHGWSSWM